MGKVKLYTILILVGIVTLLTCTFISTFIPYLSHRLLAFLSALITWWVVVSLKRVLKAPPSDPRLKSNPNFMNNFMNKIKQTPSSDLWKNLFLGLLVLMLCIGMGVWAYSNRNVLGQYVYLDSMDRLHVNSNCKLLKQEINNTTKTINRIDVSFLTSDPEGGYCMKCIDDNSFEIISGIIAVNNADKVKFVYNVLIKEGYNMESEAEFRENITDPTKRRSVYDALVKEGYNMEPFDEFERNLGFDNIAKEKIKKYRYE